MRKHLALALVVLTTALFLATCGVDDTDQSSARISTSGGSASSAQGSSAAATPSLSRYTSAPDLSGTPQALTQWVGKQPVVVNFWGTWCPPCRKEIPDLIQLYKEYNPKGVEIVSLAVRDTPSQVRSFAESAGMDWVHLLATAQSVEAFQLTGSVPTTIFYDRTGKEVARFVGARNYDTFKKAFEQIAAS